MTSIFMTHYLLRHIYQGVNVTINHFYRSFQLHQFQMNSSNDFGIRRVGTEFYRANPRYRFSWGWLIEVIMDKLNWHGHPNNVFIQDNPWKIISNRFYGAK